MLSLTIPWTVLQGAIYGLDNAKEITLSGRMIRRGEFSKFLPIQLSASMRIISVSVNPTA
jgi:hypothetical protein